MHCPSCNEPLPADAVLCVNCGLNLQTGKRLKTVVTKERKVIQGWDRDLGGSPLRRRYILAAALGAAATVGAVVAGALLPLEYRVVIALLGWVACAVVIVGYVGTFARVRIRQDGKGNIVVGIAPSFFFIPLGERTTKLSKFNVLWTDYRAVEDSEGETVWERQILDLGSDRNDRRLRVFQGTNGDRMRELCDLLEDLGDLEVRRA